MILCTESGLQNEHQDSLSIRFDTSIATNCTEPVSQSTACSLAYRAWANCYRPQIIRPGFPISTSSVSYVVSVFPIRQHLNFTLVYQLDATTRFCHQAISAPHHTCHAVITASFQIDVPGLKLRAYFSRTILADLRNVTTKRIRPHASFSPPSRLSTHPVKMLYTSRTTSITTKDGIVINEHRVVSGYCFHDGKSAVDWSDLDHERSVHKSVIDEATFTVNSTYRIFHSVFQRAK